MTKPATIGDNASASGYIKRWLNILSEQDTLAEDLKELKEEIKGAGYTKGQLKAMALAIKEHRKPIDAVIKANANQYFADSDGQYVIFAE